MTTVCVVLVIWTIMMNRYNSENVIPRWEKVRREAYEQPNICKHCVYCCGTVCECESIVQWGPDCWYGVEGIKVWKQFLSLTGKVDYAIGDNINHVCRSHYRTIHKLRSTRTCSVYMFSLHVHSKLQLELNL